ncbi:MAG: HXXEE domain-containing protein [Candidatus Heimdallarchaeum endolithica]|uniref:HXXEE domain-containing protein n=1 Tax=Candidatus Heimdallarchaeum endolithica TaxID=2876572 RepID=A0A9Y1BS16_9ARCH|nr:MAG: HXXEE domain-containing protein [Candidatus Heimdallarchaeum endolithica]
MKLKKFNTIWPKVGGFFAIVIIFIVIFLWKNSSLTNKLSLLYWLNLAVLMLHEFEEYVFPGGFKQFINYKTVFAVEDSSGFEPINDVVVVVINLGVWAIFVFAALISSIAPWLGFAMIIFNVVNIVGHLLVFQKKVKGYNPGAVTAFLMIPFLVLSSIFIISNQFLTTLGYVLAVLIGVLCGASLPIIGVIIKKKAKH